MYFYLKEPKSKKPTPIYILIYINSEKKQLKYSTGLKINPVDWNFKSRMPLAKRGAAGIYNSNLSAKLQKFVKVINELEITSSSDLRKILDVKFRGKEEAACVLDFFNEFILEKKRMKSVTNLTINVYYEILNKLKDYEKEHKKILKFKDLNEAFFIDFISFLREKYDLYDTSTGNRIGNVKTFLLWAIRRGHKVPVDFKSVSLPKRDTDDVALSFKDLDALESLELTGIDQKVRDLFLIGCYSGQRFSDYSVFEISDVRKGMTVKRAEKTENASFIPLHPKLKRLLDFYDWHLPKISRVHFNNKLKHICKLAGFDEIIKKTSFQGSHKKVEKNPRYKMVSSHTARRTFITLSSERGMPDHVIMAITGIRDAKTLVKYKKVNKASVQSIAESIWGG